MFEVFLAALDFFAKAAVAVLATLVAVRLALSRFKTEALWNKKFEAYNKILESLHFARLEAAENYDLALKMDDGESPPKYTTAYQAHLDELERTRLKAQSEVRKFLDIGDLFISGEAISFLQTTLKPRFDDWRNTSGAEFWETEEENMRKAIQRMQEFARSDLDLRPLR